MRIFVTGATGFIGTALTRELIAHGHQLLGLTRSKAGAEALTAAGAEPLHGDINDLALLKRAATETDGTIHLAFNHDFSTFAQNCEDDRRVVEALGEAVTGTSKPLIITSGTAIADVAPGELAREDSPAIGSARHSRAMSEEAAQAAAAKGANVSIVRLPQVHDPRRQGLISFLIFAARQHGEVAYLGDGANRWPAAPLQAVAQLYRLAFEKAEPGAIYNAVAEEGVQMRAIAEVLGRKLGLPVKSIPPEDSAAHFGWLAMFAGNDMPASSAQTRAKLGWTPTGPSLLDDLERLEVPAEATA